MLTRRRFLACSPLLILQPHPPVRIVVRGGGEGNRGAALGLEEMQRTAALVGRVIDGSPHADAAIVDIASGTLTSAGEVFRMAAGEAQRRRAIEAWRAEHPGAAPHAAVEWHPDLVRFGAEQLNQRFERRFGARMTAREWLGWIAIKIAVDAQLRGLPLAKGRYDGHKGAALHFGDGSRLVQPLCVVDGSGRLLGVAPPE